MKDIKDVVSEFNEYVNMTASDLEKWLKSDESNAAGWSKDGGEGGESVGHESGRKIVEILKSNPDKDPDKYTDDHLQHMRKVASYCKRHLAQESAGNKDKSPEEVKETKSYVSLKNWGHDFLKAQKKNAGSANGGGRKSASKKTAEDEAEQGATEEEAEEDEGKKAGDKRKKSDTQNGSNKKRETRSTTSARKNESRRKDHSQDQDQDSAQDDDKDEDGNGDEEEQTDQKDGEEEEEHSKSGKKSAKKGPKKGQTVSWNWGSGNPQGKVLDVKEDKATITTKRGNEVSRDGDAEDPAVILDTGKSKAIKSAHELN